MRIAGSVAIVTGGARGLGKAFSEELLKRGAKGVCIADVSVAEGQDTEQFLRRTYGEDKSLFVKCDVSNESDFRGLWTAAVKKYKYVDIMVNNAGILNESDPNRTIAINLVGCMTGTSLALEHMRKDLGGNGGLIVNIASTGGLFPVFFMPAYAASKYGVVGFTRSWAANPLIKSFGVSVACICPAFSETNMLSSTVGETGGQSRLVTYKQNKEYVHQIIDQIGVNSVDVVAAAFTEVVEKEDNNGAVVTIEKSRGTYYGFTKHPHKL